MRKSGVLLPISSIPSKYGIGTFGRKAYEFVDFLEKAGQSYWQILPLGPTGFGDSPYQSFSTFAGNPYYIDLELLLLEGLLTNKHISEYTKDCVSDNGEKNVDYENLYNTRFTILYEAFKTFSKNNHHDEPQYREFCDKNKYWLDDYALFMAVKENAFDGKGFCDWDKDIKLREESAIAAYTKEYKEKISFYKFQQYYFMKQWLPLKEYANEKGIQIIGDIPIYVAYDSADTWAEPNLFLFDQTLTPTVVAGCPPQPHETSGGQIWGNPLYNWEEHKNTGYAWWKRRMEHSYELYNIVRIDHFLSFDQYYTIPYGSETAEFGTLEQGPGYDLFEKIMFSDNQNDKKVSAKVIAEDLGTVTESAKQLIERTGFPGMKIMQYAFNCGFESDHLPHNHIKNCVVYTGTHDNDTVVGWWNSLNQWDKNFAEKYMNIKSGQDINWSLLKAALASVADTVIIPMQDYLGLDSDARLNSPSTMGKNWVWRMAEKDINDELAEKIYEITKVFWR
ncbi:MAG: 4-alpha-glucanotransferase [Oscillospiraceae bacterium]|nr:4-alpha-glucanotransferase [Oscillospiraceae bacterium]